MSKLQKRAVWDLPIRIFHWGLALSVFASMFIVYGKKYLTLHIISGALAFALIFGRVVWGFVGTRYAKFSAFAKSLSDVRQEFSFLGEKQIHTVGHPAVAGWVMLFLIFCGFCVGVSGWCVFLFTDTVSKESALYIHEIFANTLLVIAFVHIQGVALHLFLHRDGIIKGMIDGKRPAYLHEQIAPLGFLQKVVAIIWFGGSITVALWALK